MVVTIISRIPSPNQRPAFGRKPLEHDGILIASAGHLHECILQYGSTMMSGSGDNGLKPSRWMDIRSILVCTTFCTFFMQVQILWNYSPSFVQLASLVQLIKWTWQTFVGNYRYFCATVLQAPNCTKL